MVFCFSLLIGACHRAIKKDQRDGHGQDQGPAVSRAPREEKDKQAENALFEAIAA